jgi:hypothetical protein
MKANGLKTYLGRERVPGEGFQNGGLARVVQPQQEDSQFSVLGGLQLPEVEFVNC